MIRYALAVAVAVCLTPAWAEAQTNVLTIHIAQADVRKVPSIASPVVGQAPRGSVLEVTRNLGDWVKVSWTADPDGFGYVRVTAGTLSRTTGPVPGRAAEPRPSRAAVDPEPSSPTAYVRNDVADVDRRILARSQASEYVMPPTHRIGLGGLLSGATIGFGVSGRAWTKRGLGVQVEMSRYSLTAPAAASRITAIQFAPSVLYSLPEALTDYLWVRPYVGGGARWASSTLNPGTPASISEKRRSWQVFGGTELALSNAPHIALGADLRYDSSRRPLAGFDFGGVGFSLSAHWYVR
jgi:hypothetical protein